MSHQKKKSRVAPAFLVCISYMMKRNIGLE